MPRLRLARSAGPPARRRVLRERREGGGRGGDDASCRRGAIREPRHRRDGVAVRPLDRQARSAYRAAPCRPRGHALPADRLGRRLRADCPSPGGARLGGRGDLLHLRAHQQRGRLPLPGARPGARDQQPAGLLEHVPRIKQHRARPDDRDRQGQRHPRGHPPSGSARHRRPESRHQPPPDAERARYRQAPRAPRSSRSTRCPRPG